MKNLEAEVAKLNQIIAEADAERLRQKKEYDVTINERDILGTQLIRRNDELVSGAALRKLVATQTCFRISSDDGSLVHKVACALLQSSKRLFYTSALASNTHHHAGQPKGKPMLSLALAVFSAVRACEMSGLV
eukprot:5296959-Pleurochrysis_carterae.AAC.3